MFASDDENENAAAASGTNNNADDEGNTTTVVMKKNTPCTAITPINPNSRQGQVLWEAATKPPANWAPLEVSIKN